MTNQTIPTETLLALREAGFPQPSVGTAVEGHWINLSASGESEKDFVFHPTHGKLYAKLVQTGEILTLSLHTTMNHNGGDSTKMIHCADLVFEGAERPERISSLSERSPEESLALLWLEVNKRG